MRTARLRTADEISDTNAQRRQGRSLYAIEAQGLSKMYSLRHDRTPTYSTLRDAISATTGALARRALMRQQAPATSMVREEFWALRDVSFSIPPGERVGVIGRNGAGKSTLLKIISRIAEPTQGCVKIRGRVASLLEVGTGFHPELTGRENVYLNGTILGMTRAEIKRNFDEIIAFAEVEGFLDTPVKHFSSGMHVRLAFAVAAHLEPDVLIVDEVLAVGDSHFQKKCLGKMEEVGRGGRTVIFVSHSLGSVQALTERCIVLEKGNLMFDGPTRAAIDRYQELALNLDGTGSDVSFYRRSYYHPDLGPVAIDKIWFGGFAPGQVALDLGADFTINVAIIVRSRIAAAKMSLGLLKDDGQTAVVIYSADRNFEVNLDPGSRVVQVRVRGLPLAPGRYTLNLGINQSVETTAWDGVANFPAFEVRNSGRVTEWPQRPWGSVHWDDVEWSIE